MRNESLDYTLLRNLRYQRFLAQEKRLHDELYCLPTEDIDQKIAELDLAIAEKEKAAGSSME